MRSGVENEQGACYRASLGVMGMSRPVPFQLAPAQPNWVLVPLASPHWGSRPASPPER